VGVRGARVLGDTSGPACTCNAQTHSSPMSFVHDYDCTMQ